MKSNFIRWSSIAFLTFLYFIFSLFFTTSVSAGPEVSLVRVDNDIVQETRNGSMWQFKRSKRIRTREEVEQYLHILNSGQYNDWRLPTKSELYRFLELFDWKKNGDVKIKFEGVYWLRNEGFEAKAGEWELDDMCGPVRVFYNHRTGYIRAIRP